MKFACEIRNGKIFGHVELGQDWMTTQFVARTAYEAVERALEAIQPSWAGKPDRKKAKKEAKKEPKKEAKSEIVNISDNEYIEPDLP